MDGAGVVHEFEETALGEAWDGGPVLVSWFDDAGTDGSAGTAPPRSQEPLAAPHGGALDALGRPCGATVAPPRSQEPLAAPHGGALDALGRPCGVNVVIHEFVHKLDMENGTVDGLPRLPADMSRQEWIDAFEPAYEDFCRRVDAADRHGRETLLDPYGAEHPAEFFAVMSEAFFETPILLRSEYPAVYDQLRRYYRQDPARQRSAT
jgi:Mlc titration factor MtfA (ptsG expression regulator)